MYVADSESSSIRCVTVSNGSVKGVVGGGLDPMVTTCPAHYMPRPLCYIPARRTCLRLGTRMGRGGRRNYSIPWAWLGILTMLYCI